MKELLGIFILTWIIPIRLLIYCLEMVVMMMTIDKNEVIINDDK